MTRPTLIVPPPPSPPPPSPPPPSSPPRLPPPQAAIARVRTPVPAVASRRRRNSPEDVIALSRWMGVTCFIARPSLQEPVVSESLCPASRRPPGNRCISVTWHPDVCGGSALRGGVDERCNHVRRGGRRAGGHPAS